MNYFALGFGAVALTAVGAIDYANQASAAGQSPGSFPVSAYFASYGQRIDGVREARADAAEAKARKARRSAGARPYLPDAPEGWTRRAWAEGDNSAIAQEPRKLVEDDAPQLLKNMAAKSEDAIEKKRDTETWVYQRGSDIVAIRAAYKARDGERDMAGAIKDTIASVGMAVQSKPQGWAVIGGVAYALRPADAMNPAAPNLSMLGTPFVSLAAHLGFHDEIALTVQSNADIDATRALLGAIDYDGLNTLLTYPLANIGSAAPDVAPEHEQELATFLLNLRQDLLNRRSAEAQQWLARAMSPENAMQMAMNEVTAGWLSAGSLADTKAATLQTEQAVTDGGMFGGLANAVTSFLDTGPTQTGNAGQTATAEPSRPPKRLQLSGGTSCLEGSAARFCRD